MKFKYILTLVVVLAVTTFSNAQKFGYLNSNELLILHPDVKSTDAKLEAYQKQLLEKGQQMASTFQTNYQNYVQEVEAGKLSKIQMQERENSLTQEQNKIREYEMEMQQKLLQKREELYKPILEKIQTAINQVGKENNYSFIFDSGAGAVIFAQESDNVLNLVKEKLGL